MSRFRSQLRTELQLVARNGEQLLLTVGIPVLLLVFFSGSASPRWGAAG